MIELRPTVKRDLSLYSVLAWEKGYRVYLQEKLGWEYPIIFYYDGSKVNFYHQLPDFEYFKKVITQRLISDDALFTKLNAEFLADIAELKTKVGKLRVEDLPVLSELIGRAMAFYMFVVSDAFCKAKPEAFASREASQGVLYNLDNEVDTLLDHGPKEYIVEGGKVLENVSFAEYCKERGLKNPEAPMQNTIYKMLERDTTLAMQAFFDIAMTDGMQDALGFSIPQRPMELHYVTEANIQIWESREGEKWFLDRLLEENTKSTAFMESVEGRYKPLLAQIEVFWQKGSLTDKGELKEYFELLRKAIPFMATCFYVGLDERTPEAAQKVAVRMREKDELFAHGDEFVRDCFAALGRDRELAYLVLPEEFLGTLPTDEELRRRAKGAVLVDGKELVVETMEEFAKRPHNFVLEGIDGPGEVVASEVTGQIAQKGVVQGTVRIVKNRKQAALVEEGDIIVSPMTTPDFIDAMKRAAAFVTDEGGITCHAGIVAREMKKPCVIGTKIATQIFKDGDTVEVDAEKGIVRKL